MANELTLKEMNDFNDALALSETDKGVGFITSGELGKVIGELEVQPTEAELTAMITDLDPDGEGSIDFQRFLELANGFAKSLVKDPASNEHLKKTFNAFDIDKDGFISAAELRESIRDLGQKMTTEEANDIIQHADLDGDGKLSYEEFITMMAQA